MFTSLGKNDLVLMSFVLQEDFNRTSLVVSPSKNPHIIAPVGSACNTIPPLNILGKVKQLQELKENARTIEKKINILALLFLF